MERYLLGLLVVLFLFLVTDGVNSQQGVATPGTKLTSRPNISIAVRNPGGIKNLKYGDTCVTEGHAELTAIGEDGGRVLVDYRSNEVSYGCPNGTIGFVDSKTWRDLVQWSQEQRLKLDQLERDRGVVRDLMQKFERK